MSKITISPCSVLKGTIRVPGDKSISHRAAMMGALARGVTHVDGFLMAEDCLSTLKILQALGSEIECAGEDELIIKGAGLNGLKEPDHVLDAGNSGTTMRLMSGILAAQPFFSMITGDASLRKRPMKRVINPLSMMGARIWARVSDSLPPMAIKGGGLHTITYTSTHASAQVKSAILLAGLWVDGKSEVIEPSLSRDHTERIFRHFGILCESDGLKSSVYGGKSFSGRTFKVPGDFSAAAFFIVAALITKKAEIVLKDVGINPTRTGLLDVLKGMGAQIEVMDARNMSGEPFADLRCSSSKLSGVEIDGGELVPRMIDEFPILFLAATQAEGDTVIRGVHELRVKESDRIATMAEELRKVGAEVEEFDDGMVIKGKQSLKGGKCASHGDHRVAMTMAIAGLISHKGTVVEDWDCVHTSFPGFLTVLETLKGSPHSHPPVESNLIA